MYMVGRSGTVYTFAIKWLPECFIGPDPRSLQLGAVICKWLCLAWTASHQAPAGMNWFHWAFTITASGWILTQSVYVPSDLEPDSFLLCSQN